MNRINFMSTVTGLAALSLIGCGSGSGGTASGYVPKKPAPLADAMVKPGDEASYYPFAVGNQWTFDSEITNSINNVTQSIKKQEVTYRLDKLVPGPHGGQDATFAVLNDGKPTNTEVWRLDSTGLYQVASGKTTPTVINPPQIMVPFPAKVGATFKWSGTVNVEKGPPVKISLAGSIQGQEPIDTEMGRYNALAVFSDGTRSTPTGPADLASKLWLIPGKGIGRFALEMTGTVADPKVKGKTYVYRVSQIMKLKNVSLKK